jgi:heterogeneous nuclear ribonucleoprotein U-like protein 1
MIGLPGSGKSFWASKHAAENPEKRYTLLGTKHLLERMKIQGVARKPGSGPGRWEKLIELCNRGLLTLNDIACKRRRNFILDQPHVYISDQRRKMRVYGDFKRIAVIVVPNEEEYKKRSKQRLDIEGKDIPEAAVNEMRANLTLPELEYQWFNEIIYTDLEQEAAQAEVNRENERGKKALSQRNRHGDFNRGGRDFNQRNDRRWGNGGGNQRNDRNDFRRNDRWGPRNQMNNMGGSSSGGGGGGYRRDFDFNRRGGNWNRPDNWQNSPRQGGYGGEIFKLKLDKIS